MIDQLRQHLKALKNDPKIEEVTFKQAQLLYFEGSCQVLSHANDAFDVLVTDDEETSSEVGIRIGEHGITLIGSDRKPAAWDAYGIAALLQVIEELAEPERKTPPSGKKYTRKGMIKRVMAERKTKAAKAGYTIRFADNIHGEHVLTDNKGQSYKITLRDFVNETGYIDNPDLKTNKLGTTKHLMFAFETLKNDPSLFRRLEKTYPFVEIFLDPLNEYRITWHYPHELPGDIKMLIDKYFSEKSFIDDEEEKGFLPFIREALPHKKIKIRPEVEEKVRKAWDREMLKVVSETEALDLSLIKTELFPYQQQGVHFATFRDGAILADEMGLGKTIQSIAAAVNKKKLFGFNRTLIVCPASLKEQWKQEIARFSFETAVIADGMPAARRHTYHHTRDYFVIVNYETVLRDWKEINKMEPDFIILDEAQKIKNFNTVTAQSIKLLKKKHALVITGTPIENRLSDLYSIMQFIDPGFLGPLWEFSYQYCLFDGHVHDKITGYYNLQHLSEKLSPIVLRREKRAVLKDLPKVTEITIPVNLHPEQVMLHTNYAHGIAKILSKKFITPFDMQKLMLLMSNMRMVCDSTYLIDKETHISPKLDELEDVLLNQLDLKGNQGKVIIFSEWVTMLQLIGKKLHEWGIGFAMLSGKVAVKNRNALVKKFETNPDCQVFLSTEAGGAGLNLQVANAVINFEVPWNPAKKNQRIGRIDRLGQRSKQLTVINFIARNSIEMKIASGLTLKQNLFEGVLSPDSTLDEVDFSASGKAQFLQQMEELVGGFSYEEAEEEPETEAADPLLTEAEDTDDIFAVDVTADKKVATVSDPEETVAGTQSEVQEAKMKEMENVMNHGLEFLSGLFKMATGSAEGLEGRKMEFDKNTGEVVMRFKLPG